MSVDDILFAPIIKTDIRIPEIWSTVINRIQTLAPWHNATLAGGALRDLDNMRPVKDVDIFVPFIDNVAARAMLADITTDFHEPDLMGIEHNIHNVSQVGAEGISHFWFQQDGWKFEISQKIEPFDSKTLLESFDLGICMISLVGKTIYRRPEYLTDVANKTITVVKATGGREQCHAERILSKYSGWKIIPLPGSP